MKKLIFSFLCLFILSCNNSSQNEVGEEQVENEIKNEVLVLGLIHGRHRTAEEFSIEILTDIIKKINPDLILTEIPPDRFPTAAEEYKNNDTITEPRVVRFPEYVDVVFPLTKEMDFEIIPTAGWTKEMADARSAKLKSISEDPERTSDWQEYTKAGAKSDSLINARGLENDPWWINSDEYDEFVEVRLSVYNRLFNEELGLGGWDNINEAHYGHIENALEKHKNQGKRILITYGAGHKGWFLRELKKRDDINLLSFEEVYPKGG